MTTELPERATRTSFIVWRQDANGSWHSNSEWDKKSAAALRASQLTAKPNQWCIATKIVKCERELAE